MAKGDRNPNRNSKINRHEKVCQLLLSGNPVTPEEIMNFFKGTDQESVMYRLPQNINYIRTDGGIIKTIKDGRKVKAYQLINIEDFTPEGRYRPQPKTVDTSVKSVASVTAEVTTNKVVEKTEVKTPLQIITPVTI